MEAQLLGQFTYSNPTIYSCIVIHDEKKKIVIIIIKLLRV